VRAWPRTRSGKVITTGRLLNARSRPFFLEWQPAPTQGRLRGLRCAARPFRTPTLWPANGSRRGPRATLCPITLGDIPPKRMDFRNSGVSGAQFVASVKILNYTQRKSWHWVPLLSEGSLQGSWDRDSLIVVSDSEQRSGASAQLECAHGSADFGMQAALMSVVENVLRPISRPMILRPAQAAVGLRAHATLINAAPATVPLSACRVLFARFFLPCAQFVFRFVLRPSSLSLWEWAGARAREGSVGVR